MDSDSALHVPASPVATLSLTTDFRGRGDLLRSVRQLVEQLCADEGVGEDDKHSVILASQELLENLVKYSEDEQSQFCLTLSLSEIGKRSLSIRTKNRATAEQIARLEEICANLEEAPRPSIVYRSMVESSQVRSQSQLGIARLVVELGMTVTCSDSEGVVVLTAQHRGNLEVKGP